MAVWRGARRRMVVRPGWRWTFEQGHKVWRMVVDAPGATCMSVASASTTCPKGQLFCTTPTVGRWGPWTTATRRLGAVWRRGRAHGEIGGGIPAARTSTPCRCPSTKLSKVPSAERLAHGGRRPGSFGNSGACNINVNCPEGATWATEKRSVALIVQGGFAAAREAW